MASLTSPSLRRLRPVRLTDVPLEQRIKAAHVCARYAHDAEEAQELLLAAVAPSRTVYFVAA